MKAWLAIALPEETRLNWTRNGRQQTATNTLREKHLRPAHVSGKKRKKRGKKKRKKKEKKGKREKREKRGEKVEKGEKGEKGEKC